MQTREEINKCNYYIDKTEGSSIKIGRHNIGRLTADSIEYCTNKKGNNNEKTDKNKANNR